MKRASDIAGWYGKIPALGDFASRRLPPGFISAWDAWLQRGLAASRASLKERWPDAYLHAPVWRFALFPGVCGDQAWIGVMMPGIDKVGRHFPLTIALALEPHPEIFALLFTTQSWFDAIEQVALSSLNGDALPDDLECQLAKHPFPPHSPSLDTHTTVRELIHWWTNPLPPSLTLKLPLIGGALADAGIGLLTSTGAGRSLWWCQTGGIVQLHAFAGLPPDHCFAALLGAVACDEKTL